MGAVRKRKSCRCDRRYGMEWELDASPEYQLAEPLAQKLKSPVKTALTRCLEAWETP